MIARTTALALAATAAGMLAGCAGGNGKVSTAPPRPVDVVDTMVVQTIPAAINMDDRPGPDGLEVCVHLFRYSAPLPVTVRGALEFTLYEGVIGQSHLAEARAFRSWRFTGRELDACRIRSAVGWGYAMRLIWGRDAPKTSSVTLVVRYMPIRGSPIGSNPMAIPIGPQ